jgi:ATPase family protein associated with various cellular activities (AAA)
MIDWKSFQFGELGYRLEISPESIGTGPLIKRALEGKDPLYKLYKEGYSETSYKDIATQIVGLGGRKIYESVASGAEDNIYVWSDGGTEGLTAILEASLSKSKLLTINAFSSVPHLTEYLKDISKIFTPPSKKGYVFAITKNSHGLGLTRIGYAGSKFEPGNYTDAVVSDYQYVVEDLKSKDPTGRVIILDGPTGSGKTYLTRSILAEITTAMFVIVPPNMIASMGGPELLPLLLKTKEDYGKKGPIVLILEDADQCLAPRHETDPSSISTILNLGDGIFGSLFDMRIIATTNAKAKEIDAAIVRDMRLSKRITVDYLPYELADKIFKRLLKDDKKEFPIPVVEEYSMKPSQGKKKFSLATVYKTARLAGWKSEVLEKAESEPASRWEKSYYDDEDF